MTFFFDRCVPVVLAKMIAAYEADSHEVVYLDDEFKINTPDVEWMGELDGRNPRPVVITGDVGILRNKVERQVLDGLSLKFFCLMKQWNKMGFHERGWKFFKVWPLIVDKARSEKGRIFEVTAGRTLNVYRVG